MAYESTIFNQLFNSIPRYDFETYATAHDGDRYRKGFTCWKQFLVLLYAQVSGKSSLRDIYSGLLAHPSRLYPLGLLSACFVYIYS